MGADRAWRRRASGAALGDGFRRDAGPGRFQTTRARRGPAASLAAAAPWLHELDPPPWACLLHLGQAGLLWKVVAAGRLGEPPSGQSPKGLKGGQPLRSRSRRLGSALSEYLTCRTTQDASRGSISFSPACERAAIQAMGEHTIQRPTCSTRPRNGFVPKDSFRPIRGWLQRPRYHLHELALGGRALKEARVHRNVC